MVRACRGTLGINHYADSLCLGKQWHAQKKAFRPTAGLSSYEKRQKDRTAMVQMKAKEKEMKEEKEEGRQVYHHYPLSNTCWLVLTTC